MKKNNYMDDGGSEFPRVTEQAYFVPEGSGGAPSDSFRSTDQTPASTFITDSSATPPSNYQSNTESANSSTTKKSPCGDLGDFTRVKSNLACHPKEIVSECGKNVKSSVEVAGFAPAESWIASQIPYSSTPTPSPSYRNQKNHAINWLPIIVIALFVIGAIPPVAVVVMQAFPAKETVAVSPLGKQTEAIASPVSEDSTTPTQTTPYSPSDYIVLSQKYFVDAQTLSQNHQQSDDDKKEIIGKLQQSIDTISEGIITYPNRADLLVQRANIYLAVKSIAPQAEQLAMQDIQAAQKISQSPNHPNPSHLPKGLELVRDQQALARNVVVASPDQTASPYVDATNGSAVTGTAVIPAGQTQITVDNAYVTDAAPIYVVPTEQTAGSISVVAKKAGSGFTVALDSAQTTDVSFKYWVTR